MKQCIWTFFCVSLLGIQVLSLPVSGDDQLQPASLVRLIEIQGVSGFEGDVRDYVTSQLPEGVAAHTDEMGNLIVTLGHGFPHTLVTAHLDEHGYIISEITSDGFLRLHRVTRGIGHPLFDQFFYGQPVTIRTKGGDYISGVTAAESLHLHGRSRAGAGRIKGLSELWVDVGAKSRSEVARLGIRLLDTVSLRSRVQFLANGRLSGVSAQARGGAWTLLELVRSLVPGGEVQGTLSLVWTVQEMFGGRGLHRVAQALKPDRVLIISDRFLPSAPDVNAQGGVGRLGAGVLLSPSDSQLIQVAEGKNIPVQTVTHPRPRRAGYSGGLNWSTADVHALGLPVIFAQSPVEVIDQRDLTAMVQLLRVVIGQSDPYIRETSVRQVKLPSSPPGEAAVGVLRRLIETYAVSGHEAPMREAITSLLPDWVEPQVDDRGNLTVSFGQGEKRLLFVAHMDEVGYEVNGIREDGRVTVRKQGGFLDILYEAHPVLIHTRRGPLPAVLSPREEYFQARSGTPRLEALTVYLGTDSRRETEALGVVVGNPITVPKQLIQLRGGRVSGRSIDDRNGCAALLLALKRLDPLRVPNRVTFAWVVEEEIGLRGAAYLSHRLRPDYVFAVDTFVSSDSPLESSRFAYAQLGSGAVVRAVDNSNIAPAEVVRRIEELAERQRIPVSIGVTGGGNDGSVFTPQGSVDIPISWPLRYSHSPVELADLYDLTALVDLIFTLTREF